jgi:hypothetical protein
MFASETVCKLVKRTRKNIMKTIAEFDKPYDALLILLKDELQVNSIEYQISGENGHDIQYNSLSFEIQVMVEDRDFDVTGAIFNEVLKRKKPS